MCVKFDLMGNFIVVDRKAGLRNEMQEPNVLSRAEEGQHAGQQEARRTCVQVSPGEHVYDCIADIGICIRSCRVLTSACCRPLGLYAHTDGCTCSVMQSDTNAETRTDVLVQALACIAN